MRTKLVLILILSASLLAMCSPASPTTLLNTIPTVTPTLQFVQPILPGTPTYPIMIITTTPIITQQVVLDWAAKVIRMLKDKDMATLAGYVHPQMGLRFSPYASVKDTDQVFPANKVAGLMADTTIYTWGAYYGSGAPIDLTFADYFAKFIYDVDFANAPKLALNYRLGVSTTMDNSAKFYPGAMVVEYYFPGFDPSLEGMDWRSLRLVFMQDNTTWYLVGIIHDQWTT